MLLAPNESAFAQEIEHSQAQQRLAQLEAIHRVATTLRSAETVQEMLALLVEETARVLDAAAVTIWLYDTEREDLYQAAADGFPSLTLRLKPGQGIAGHVFSSGVPHISSDFKNDPRTSESARWQVPAGLAGAAVPIQNAQQTIGVYFVSVLLPRELTSDEVRLLTILADLAGVALHRMQLQERTQQQLRRLAALRLVDAALGTSLDLKVVLNLVLDQITTHSDADAAAFWLLHPQTQTLELAAGRGFRSPGLEHLRLDLPEALFTRAIMDRKTTWVPDLSQAEYAHHLQHLPEDRFAAAVAIPLVARNRICGVLSIYQRKRLEPDPEGLDWYELLARQAALAIDNGSLVEDLRSNVELGGAIDATIEAWARALDLHENEVEGHSTHLADITLQVARAMQIDEPLLVHMRRGALLHDVGMIAIPDKLRLKAGSLTKKEWEIMRQHPIHAFNLLQPIPTLRPAIDIPYCHHEKWNGTGYPHQLSGEAIPLAARIFAVVDVWDALRSDRAFRAAWPEKKVRERLAALAGIQFDPRVVETFLALTENQSI